MPFSIPGYDPNEVKLFSRCGRNHASSKKASVSYKKQPRKQNIIKTNMIRKQKQTICPFDMTQSRIQRQKKYKKQQTPAVGQYNPKTTTKPKLTWDILKTYQNRSKKQVMINKDNINQLTLSNSQATNIQQLQEQQNFQSKQNHHISAKFKQQPRNMLQTEQSRRYHTVKSQVDMSRMTGRHNFKTDISKQSLDTSNIDICKSIQAVKNKTSKNIFFKKQISRERAYHTKKQITPNDYYYDYTIVKPNNKAIVSFDKVKSRKDNKKQPMDLSYSYTHYDFDSYVWEGKSTVYPNTKVSVVDFDKDRGRYN